MDHAWICRMTVVIVVTAIAMDETPPLIDGDEPSPSQIDSREGNGRRLTMTSTDLVSDSGSDDEEQIVYQHWKVLEWDKDEISEDQETFESLLNLMKNVEDADVHPLKAFLIDSIWNNTCSVQTLCSEYPKWFQCNEQHELTDIQVGFQMDHLNLLMVPNSVERLQMRSKLKSISKWTDLKGKSLKRLSLGQGHKDLDLNLSELDHQQDNLPLKELKVMKTSINSYFGLKAVCQSDFMVHSSYQNMLKWVSASTLDTLIIGAKFHYKIHVPGGGNRQLSVMLWETITGQLIVKKPWENVHDHYEQIMYPPKAYLRTRYCNDAPSTNQETFLSLLELIQSAESHDEYIQTLKEYLSSAICNDMCSVNTLCRNYPRNFVCNEKDQLSKVVLGKGLSIHHFNLQMIPNTVETLQIDGINLKTMSKWADLKGKSLKRMYVIGRIPIES